MSHSLMDLLCNSYSIDRKFAQIKTQNGQVDIQVDVNRLMENLG